MTAPRVIGSAALATVALAALGAGCSDDPPNDVKVTAFRRIAADNCDVAIPGGDDLSTALIDKLPFRICTASSRPVDNHLALGEGVDLVIDYGDVEFSAGTAVNNPTVTVTINGAANALAPSILPGVKDGGGAFFTASFVTPQAPSSVLSMVVQGAPDFARPRVLAFVIDDTAPLVVVDECGSRSNCTLLAGSQMVTVRISSSGVTTQTATLRSFLDGVEQGAQSVMLTRPLVGNRMEAAPKLDIPLAPAGTLWSLSAEVGPSTFTTTPAITIGDLPLTVTVDQCPTMPCSMLAGVATASVHITVGSGKAQTVQLRQIINGVPQPNPQTVMVNQMTSGGFTQLALVDAPAAPPGTTWNLRAELGPFTGQLAQPIHLDPPDVNVTIDQCPSPSCTLAGGVTTAVVRVSAAGQRTQHITLRSQLDGVLQSTTLPVVDATQVVGDRIVGVGFVQVPAARSGAQWKVIAELGSQTDITDPVTIGAPDLQVTLDECPAAPCALPAGVGRASVRVAVEGTTAQQLILVSRVNGEPRSTTPVDVTTVAGNQVVGQAFVDVPVAAPGATWTVTTALGDATASSPPVTLTAPPVTVALACGDCQPSAGTNVTAFITAPIGLHDLTATITVVTGGGVAILVNSAVLLNAPDNTHQTISGSIPIPVPSTPGQSLIIDATAGGFRAPTLVVTIAP